MSVSRHSLSKLIVNNIVYTDPYQIACHLNEFFTTMPQKIVSEIPSVSENSPASDNYANTQHNDDIPLLSFTNSPVTETEVLDAIAMLKSKKSEDFNGVSMFFLKKFKNYLSSPLKHIINCSLTSGSVPLQFKIAKVIPLLKTGDSSQPDNYRPISLLSCFSKILEKVVCLRLSSFLESNSILSPVQFGFRKDHSVTHPMVHMMNYISTALNKKETAVAIFCDLRKAFDTVNHEILFKKMYKIGIRNKELDWFKSYLSNRKQFVSINGISSSLLEILLGVPQGSILGPILFLIYINDLPSSSLLRSLLFADDTALLARGSNINDLANFVNTEFHKVVQYFRKNKLALHPEKTKVMFFSKSHLVNSNPPTIFINFNNMDSAVNPELLVPIENISINSRIPAIRYLGVYFDPQLNFKFHIQTIVKKISKMLYFYRQAKHVLTWNAKKSLYYATIHSHLIFGIHIWSCTSDSSLTPLILKQKMSIRILYNASYNAHTEPLFKASGILPLNMLCEFFKLQFMQKFTQNFLPISFNDTWISNRMRRVDQEQIELRNSEDLDVPFARLTTTSRFPLHSFPKLWSSFSNEQIKFTRNVIEFNKLLKQHFLSMLSSVSNCTRLLCHECHLKPNINTNANLSNNQNLDRNNAF